MLPTGVPTLKPVLGSVYAKEVLGVDVLGFQVVVQDAALLAGEYGASVFHAQERLRGVVRQVHERHRHVLLLEQVPLFPLRYWEDVREGKGKHVSSVH